MNHQPQIKPAILHIKKNGRERWLSFDDHRDALEAQECYASADWNYTLAIAEHYKSGETPHDMPWK